MIRCENHSGRSNVTAYEIGEDSIIVEFGGGSTYLYNTRSTSSANIMEMKRLAAAGQGLNSYISQFVRKEYAEKLR